MGSDYADKRKRGDEQQSRHTSTEKGKPHRDSVKEQIVTPFVHESVIEPAVV
jgi:hypothetical protein